MRLHFIDALRGMAISGVVLYHLLYDINVVYGRDPAWVRQLYCRVWQEGTCFLFIAIAGFVWSMSARKKSSLRRGLELNFLGLGITAATLAFLPSETIWFGILNFMGCATLIMGALHERARRFAPAWGMALGIFAYASCRELAAGRWGVPGLFAFELPESWYFSDWLAPLGFSSPSFSSSDYFPLLPWLGAYFFGYYAYAFLRARGWDGGLARVRVPLFSALGRRSLAIYLCHQPLCLALTEILYV